MRSSCVTMGGAGLMALVFVGVGPSQADLLTADRAVQVALKNNSQVIGAEASLLDARGSLYSAYSGLLPHVSAGFRRSGSWTHHNVGNQVLGNLVTPSGRNTFDMSQYSTNPEISGLWSVLNLSNLTRWSAAGSGLEAAQLQRTAARNDVVLAVKRQFYDVVRAAQLARVNSDALKLARDDERRVRALFEVGSVSKSDVLKAQVRTAQSELDSLSSTFAVTTQRITLATTLGVPEAQLGEIDTVLTAEIKEHDEAGLLSEAEKSRPDLRAAGAEFRAAQLSLRAARLARLPYITMGGSADFEVLNSSSFTQPLDTSGVEIPNVPVRKSTRSNTDRSIGASIALNWDLFDGLATDSRIASARARYLRAEESRNALQRNLKSEVHQALLSYREAVEGDRVAARALESAEENLKLTQQKYNVGSATILDLIDAQVQLQRARSQVVGALSLIRVAEAVIDRVRGRGE